MPRDAQLLEAVTLRERHGVIEAWHPTQGLLGDLEFEFHRGDIIIIFLGVRENVRRRGIASLLMSHLEAEYPGYRINHGVRIGDGLLWASAYYGHVDSITRAPESHSV